MNNAKLVTIPFAAHFKLSADMSRKIDEEMEHMSNVPYSSVVGSIIYVMICTQPDISHAVSIDTTDVRLTFDRTKMSDPVIDYVDSDFAGDLKKRRSLTEAEHMALAKAVKETLWSSQAEGPVRRPVAPPLREPSPPTPSPALKPMPPSSPSSPAVPPPKPAAQVAVGDKNVTTLEFQRQKAKELQDFFKQKKLEEKDQGPFFGFLGKNEITNGRWAMFGFAVGC
ncbi:hypothetical protein GH714_020002 [Hevea brasiliensis]|uniref:Uncharacterized protein n=1 Tax=Hevea brasiliensis TaxID=3981 RepID=A0A6A6KRF6_HEVBR|nr:hypothetical protein GH714_020002 [Hevea brasiliensis]